MSSVWKKLVNSSERVTWLLLFCTHGLDQISIHEKLLAELTITGTSQHLVTKLSGYNN